MILSRLSWVWVQLVASKLGLKKATSLEIRRRTFPTQLLLGLTFDDKIFTPQLYSLLGLQLPSHTLCVIYANRMVVIHVISAGCRQTARYA
jgi:hypothetical protein